MAALLLAVSLGLCGGYLDLGVILVKKSTWYKERSFRSAKDFPWTVPAGHMALVAVPGVVVAALNWRRPGRVSVRVAVWLFATLALAGALLRTPLYTGATLVLAAGLGLWISDGIVAAGLALRPRRLWQCCAALLGVLGVLAAVSSGRQALTEYRATAGLRAARPGARNVVLIVWDTVRASSLSTYGYNRNTTPNLTRWAKKGVLYKRALAPAPWTYPSHSSFFTGRWPFQLNSQWKYRLDTPDPTLAEYLATQGYQTAGFAANTRGCNYETGLGRGFTHYEDYALTPWLLLARTVHGKWLLDHSVGLLDDYDKKWVRLESRSGRAVDDAFLGWLRRRRPDRPFFAFLNYFDAHEPYIPPPGYAGRFGIRPEGMADYKFLVDYVGLGKPQMRTRDVALAHDCYDDCIAYLDDQLGRLLDALQAQGLLANTDVIITSDHGEAFGDHGIFGHAYGVELDETEIPLLILSPEAPAGRVVYSPVSLRDLPATAVDLAGLSADSPFPGRSLATYWKLPIGQAPEITSPAISEQANETAFEQGPQLGRRNSEVQISLVALGFQYVRTGKGEEGLYDLAVDPNELVNLNRTPLGDQWLPVFRKMLLKVLTENPGSTEAEKAYLSTYRKWLAELVHESPPRGVALGP